MIRNEDLIRFGRRALGLSNSVPLELSPFEGRGSDRDFLRLKWNRNDSAILVHYDPRRVENSYYAGIAAFLREIGLPVPVLLGYDPARCLMVVDDLGDVDLWSYRESPWATRRSLYQKTLSVVHRLHSFPEKNFPSGRVKLMEDFGPQLYRWEHDYFMDHFVRGVCGIELAPSFGKELEAELSALTERLSRRRRTLIHRDLQSQNVLIRDGEPFLIDFQGMRFGNLFYDLGSILCDPYVQFSGNERNELLRFYFELKKRNLDWVNFQKAFWEASAQRLMQALGAYGFLGMKKGLKPFLNHIPSGLRNLSCAASHVRSLLRLRELSTKCESTLEQLPFQNHKKGIYYKS